MLRYVVGLAFHTSHVISTSSTLIVLQKKARPKWQVGLLNCPGGKALDHETGPVAMSREFFEETGLSIPPGKWDDFLMETSRSRPDEAAPDWEPYTVNYFRYRYETDQPPSLGSDLTDEPVGWMNVDQPPSDLVGNLQWVIPMALDWRKFRAHIALWDDIRRKATW